MSAAHTPGPWAVARYSPADIVAGDAESRLHLASARCGLSNDLTREEAIANARLIAAAPELAATLAAVADYWAGGDAPPELEQRIYAALRAAGVRP